MEELFEILFANAAEKYGVAEIVRNYAHEANLSTSPLDDMMLDIKKSFAGNSITLNEYQRTAGMTAIYPRNFKVIYPSLGLNGEAGEVADKVKKLIRDDAWSPGKPIDEEKKTALIKELGDVLWYVAMVSKDLDVLLSDVATMNLDKLFARKKNNKLNGSGDNR